MRTTTAVLPLLVAITACGTRGDLGETPDAAAVDGRAGIPSWPIPRQRNARALHSEGSYLYWMVDEGQTSVIKRCEKHDCGGSLTSVARLPFAGQLGFEIQGDMLYPISKQAVLRCTLGDCQMPKALISSILPEAIAFDDTHVYWSARAEAKIFSCPLDGCTAPTAVIDTGTAALELAVDVTHFYWIAADVGYPGDPIAVFSAPKDGSAAPRQIAARQNQAMGLVVRDGFLYWSTSFTLGAVARCPTAGCARGQPELLADGQYFPQFVDPAGDVLFWMNGAGAPDKSDVDRPVQLLSCSLPNCSSTIEALDEGRGGSFGVRANAPWKISETPALPAREMVVDSEAVYWFGDVVNAVPSAPIGSQVDVALRRTERTRAP
jgi:hypothetical protein